MSRSPLRREIRSAASLSAAARASSCSNSLPGVKVGLFGEKGFLLRELDLRVRHLPFLMSQRGLRSADLSFSLGDQAILVGDEDVLFGEASVAFSQQGVELACQTVLQGGDLACKIVPLSADLAR